MGSPTAPREWSWEHLQVTRPDLGSFDVIDLSPPYTRTLLGALGLSGIQFAEWKSANPGCLDSDVVGLTHEGHITEPGRIYRVGGDSYFIELDAREPLPFADASVDWVYAEHFIEHVSLADGIRWLAEVRRILVPGGLVRLTTPDLRLYAESYLSADGGLFAGLRDVLYERGARPRLPDRRAFMMNLVFFFWEHRWIYDFEELAHALTQAGFAEDAVRRCSFAVGTRADVAQMDRPHRRHETIYVEALSSAA
jgi:predicted SAM-dependent methyltransferase